MGKYNLNNLIILNLFLMTFFPCTCIIPVTFKLWSQSDLIPLCYFFLQFKGLVNEHSRFISKSSFGRYIGGASPSWDISCSCVCDVRPSSVRGWIEVHSVVILNPHPHPPSTTLISTCFTGVNVKMKRCYSETRGWRQREERRWWSVSGLSASVTRGENNVRCGRCNLQRWWHCLKK